MTPEHYMEIPSLLWSPYWGFEFARLCTITVNGMNQNTIHINRVLSLLSPDHNFSNFSDFYVRFCSDIFVYVELRIKSTSQASGTIDVRVFWTKSQEFQCLWNVRVLIRLLWDELGSFT